MPASPELLTRPNTGDAAAAALDFLLAAQDPRGAWRDFFLPATESDGWVTGYVGLALAQTADPRAHAAAERAWSHLRRVAKDDGGWGYNDATPTDADSTLWALRLAAAIGEGNSPTARAGRACLERHRRPAGGIATYASADGPRNYVGLPASVDFSAWALPHVCVSAAAAGLPGFLDDGLRTYLLAHQCEDGAWPSYWWFDSGYATAEAVEALGPGAHRDRAVQHAATRVDAATPAFGLAHTLRILALEPSAGEAAAQAATLLCASQEPNGSWRASARLRVPAPDCSDPGPDAAWKPWLGLGVMPGSLAELFERTFTITSLDHRRAFTTATALRALMALGVS
jgi:hypothetical protein